MKKLALSIAMVLFVGTSAIIVTNHVFRKAGQKEQYCPPMGNPKPIESAYRIFCTLVINTHDKEEMTIDDMGGNTQYVELSEGKEDYFFDHNKVRYHFKFRREIVEGVCLEYIVFKGKRISVSVNNPFEP